MQNLPTVITLVIFKIHKDRLVFLAEEKKLIKRPVTEEKDLDELAKHIFSSVTNLPLQKNYIEQLYTVFDLPAGLLRAKASATESRQEKKIAIVYYILLPETVSILAENLTWVDVSTIGKRDSTFPIISYAVQRLQWKIEYTNVVYSLLPETFTLSELQKVYEIILGQTLDKRNFRKKILSLDFLKVTNQKKIGNSRPAQMYRFKKREPQIVKIFS